MSDLYEDNNKVNNSMDEINANNGTDDSSDITEDYFRMLVANYMKLNDEIKALTSVIRNKREKQGNISQIIMQYTSKNGIEGIALDGQYQGMQLVTDVKEREQQVGRKGLMEIIQSKLKDDPARLKAVMDAIDGETEIVEVEKVKISKINPSNKKSTKGSKGSKNKKAYGTAANSDDNVQQAADAILLGDK